MQLIRDFGYENSYVRLTYKKVFAFQYDKCERLLWEFRSFSKVPVKPIDVLMLQPFFGFHAQGMRTIEPDRILIRLWGKSPLMLVHEIVHCFFRSKNRSFHEGLADYFQILYDNPVKKQNVLEFLKRLLVLYELDNPSAFMKIWFDSPNCDNTRNNLMLITRYINMMFVDFLLEKLGVDNYFRTHYGETSEIMTEKLCAEFFQGLYDPAVRVPRKLVRLKAKHAAVSRAWSEFAGYGLPEQGNPMKFLKSAQLSKAQNQKAIGIYRREILLYNAWLSVGHCK